MDSFKQEVTFQWRGRARIVAYVDLVLNSMGVLVVIILAIGASMVTVVEKDPIAKEGQVTEEGARGLRIFIIITAALTLLNLWAVIKLLNGTDLGMDYNQALKKVGIWRKVAIFTFICEMVGLVFMGSYINLAFDLLLWTIWGIFIYIVQKFMDELKYHTQSQDPTEVTVKN